MMKQKNRNISEALVQLQRLGIVAAILAATVLGLWFCHEMKDSHVEMGASETIDITPTQIQSIEAIGEWEFLSVSNEELVDTVRKGLFSNDELVRIYYGTLRLGVNMHQASPRWLTVEGDTVRAMLPKVGLLSKDFIDEARTKSFFESGKWKPEDKEALYQKAYRQMKAHCLTKENLQAAEANGEEQMRNMMRSMGYKNIKITWKN